MKKTKIGVLYCLAIQKSSLVQNIGHIISPDTSIKNLVLCYLFQDFILGILDTIFQLIERITDNYSDISSSSDFISSFTVTINPVNKRVPYCNQRDLVLSYNNNNANVVGYKLLSF